MNILPIIFIVALAAIWFISVAAYAIFCARKTQRRQSRYEVALANTLPAPLTHKGKKNYLSDGALTRYALFKLGTDSGHVTTCGANDVPIGNSDDAPDAAEYPTGVELLGVTNSTRVMIASEPITAGVPVFTAASGKVQDLPGSSGTYYQVGVALTAASADGDYIAVATCVAIKTVV